MNKTAAPTRRGRRNAPAPTRRPSALGWVLRGLALTLAALATLAFDLLRITLSTTVVVTAKGTGAARQGWRGGRRHFWRPVFLSALLWPTYDGAWEVWLVLSAVALGVAVRRALLARRPAAANAASARRKYVSDHELRLLAGAGAALSAWHGVLSVWPPSGLGWAAYAATYAAGALAFGVAWWRSRRVRETPAEPIDVFLERWATTVAEVAGLTPLDEDGRPAVALSVPSLAGSWLEFKQRDEGTWAGVIELTRSKASDAVKLAEDVERALNLRRNSVSLSTDPKLTVRQLRVLVVLNPDVTASRLNYWTGPTLDEAGRFVQALTKDQRPVYGRLRDNRGSVYFAGFAAPSGAGKGGAMRIGVVEAALDPDTNVIIIDGKRGAGVPYLRAGARLYVSDSKLWVPTILAFVAAMEERKDRHGEEGLDSFRPRPGEPQCLLVIDELANGVLPMGRNVVAKALKNISGTGRSVGYGFWASMQKGDEKSWGDTEIRSNVMDNGWMFVGPSTDVQTKNTSYQALQSQYGIDPGQLPEEGGWGFVVGRVLGAGGADPSRNLWLPNRRDVEEFGHEAPYGACEDVLEAGTVHPEWKEEGVFQHHLTKLSDSTLELPPPTRERIVVGPFSAPDVMHPDDEEPAQREAPSGRQAEYLKAIVASTEPMATRELARQLGDNPGTAHEALKALESKGWIERTDEKKWVES